MPLTRISSGVLSGSRYSRYRTNAIAYEPTWGKLRDRTLPAPGNHEYLTRGAAGYFGYFHDRAGESGKGYYSKNVCSWHIVALNSNIDTATGSEQVKWLQKDLSENHLTCVLAFWHHPRFSSGAHGNNLHMAAIWTTLYQHSASVVIAGHDHDYERFAPLNSAGQRDEKHGIRSFVVGTGGAKLFDFSMRGPDSEAWQANSWGVLKLTLQPDSYSWEFIPVADTKFHDSGSSRCVTK